MDTFYNFTFLLINKSKRKKIKQEYIDVWQELYENAKKNLTSRSNITLSPKNNINILLTMTTCKRYNLFTQTVNSILNTWKDIQLVDKWLVVDDNSSEEDRQKMLDYKFINYIMKTPEQKGHMDSMNIIFSHLTEVVHWIHIEDDFLFFHPMNYISTGIKGLTILSNFNVKQIMFNRNFMETFSQINLPGHITYSDSDFSLHDYTHKGNACKYWPNFSFRPSIIQADTIRSLGNFSSSNNFFEMDYAYKYTKAGYRTAFYNSITCQHIGKLCNTTGLNAYDLNCTAQFNNINSNTIKNLYVKVINLKRRPDKLKEISKKLKSLEISFDIFEAIDGSNILLTKEQELMFRNNDFNNKRGVIGCALSHYYLWKELINSNYPYYIIIEDDADFCDGFKEKLLKIIDLIKSKDLIFFGYLKSKSNKLKYYDTYHVENSETIIEPLKQDLYIGGTHCYSITKEGASGLIDFIDMHGIKHGIDYLIAKVQKIIPVYESKPHLAFAEWQDSIDNIVDSDIQYDNYPINISTDNITNDYIFLQGLDQLGNDIHVETDRNIQKLIIEANKLNCVAFNTLGFFKSSIDELTESQYFSKNDGIYIKTDYYYSKFKKK
jgi:GR25 family glycosyltransferase involved in LPS biosynthesis